MKCAFSFAATLHGQNIPSRFRSKARWHTTTNRTSLTEVLEPVVVGRDDDFGIDEDSGRKLRQLRAYEVPGLGKLGDF